MPRLRSQFRFVLPPDSFAGNEVRFPADAAHQIIRVLRLRTGDSVAALDGHGNESIVKLRVDGEVTGQVTQVASEPPSVPSVHLYLATIKPSALELAAQKCTELGIASFTAVSCARSVRNPGPSIERLGRITREALEQSGGRHLPKLRPVIPFRRAAEEASTGGLMFDPGSELGLGEAINGSADNVSILIGPEGGFSDEELQLAESAGCRRLSVGTRILRAETAAVVATALVNYELARLSTASPPPASRPVSRSTVRA
jgi:16S rRNA (uracil1498-N3)-methyltransferase